MIDMTQEQMKEKFRRSTKLYWSAIIALHGVLLFIVSSCVTTTVMLTVSIIIVMVDVFVYVVFIVVQWMPESYYTDLEVCSSCGEKAVKRVNRARCFECGMEENWRD